MSLDYLFGGGEFNWCSKGVAIRRSDVVNSQWGGGRGVIDRLRDGIHVCELDAPITCTQISRVANNTISWHRGSSDILPSKPELP